MVDERGGASMRAGRVPVTIRVNVPEHVPAAEALEFVRHSLRSSHADLHLDVRYGARPAGIPIRVGEQVRGHRPVVVRAFVTPTQLAALKADSTLVVVPEARLEPFPPPAAAPRVACATAPKADGTADDVARTLGVDRLKAAGYTGRGIVVGVVDGGITAYGRLMHVGGWEAIPQPPATGQVVGGCPEDWGTTAEGWGQHGNMIAYDVQAMAPEAELWDMRIWEPANDFAAYVGDAVNAYDAAIASFQACGVPQILVNAWGLYDSDNDPDYAFNPQSQIAQCVERAMNAGMLVLFAAGNCGDCCPFESGTLCGPGNRGPGASILGPNGHPRVMSVGAATLKGEWCGYTSQGPAGLPPNDPDKPDFCSISQFAGFFPNDSGLRPYDGGTSAAVGIAAGVVALLKQARPDLSQDECRWILRDTARPIKTSAASEGAGAGIIDALRAFRAL